MTRYKYIILFVLCMMLFPNITKAECSYERQAELSRIASNVQISYSYDVDEGDNIHFYVNITNITNDIYIKDKYNEYIYGPEYISEYPGGSTLKFIIYSNDVNCKNQSLIFRYVSLPHYNYFSLSEECKDYPNFKYCSFWGTDSSITKKKFTKEFEKYKDSINNKVNITSKEESTISIREILNANLYILIAFIFLLLLIMLKKRKKW